MIFPNYYHIKHKIITTVVAPHGITDFIHATQYNTTQELLSINTVCLLTSIGMSQNDITMMGLNTFFIISSAVHFRHDLPLTLKNKNQEIQKYIFSLITILSFIANHDLFFWYMCFLHVPKHYYTNRNVISKDMLINSFLILSFTLFLSFVGTKEVVFYPFLYPIYKSVVISHIIYQEMYVHS